MGTAIKRKPIATRVIRPNKGLEVAYRKKLLQLSEEMQASILRFVIAEYKRQGIALDENPALALGRRIARLRKQWTRRFNEFAKIQSAWFTTQADKNTTNATKSAVSDAYRNLFKSGYRNRNADVEGDATAFQRNAKAISVKMKPSKELNMVLASIRSEQVNLIKSIPERHLDQVSTLVQQSVARGRDIGGLKKELKRQFGVTERRAIVIARDQNNKASDAIQNARAQQLGARYAYWEHYSAGQKTFRQSHVHADGWKFDITKGCLIGGKRIMPGEEPNCRCGKRLILPGMPDDNDENLH
ncbi:hypothetical protein LMG33818_000040 [Halomonadaceae bacterium LMG 33818]|uniref:phage head morphogenesis protein n=1 Tax=Cernens ardua TaxID=3402176 RepID=UPI003EDB6EDB